MYPMSRIIFFNHSGSPSVVKGLLVTPENNFSGGPQDQNTFLIIIRHHLPFSHSSSHRNAVAVSRGYKTDEIIKD